MSSSSAEGVKRFSNHSLMSAGFLLRLKDLGLFFTVTSLILAGFTRVWYVCFQQTFISSAATTDSGGQGHSGVKYVGSAHFLSRAPDRIETWFHFIAEPSGFRWLTFKVKVKVRTLKMTPNKHQFSRKLNPELTENKWPWKVRISSYFVSFYWSFCFKTSWSSPHSQLQHRQ